MQKERANNEVYKKLICDLIQDVNDGRFLRQVYSYIVRERRLCGRLQQDLYTMIEGMEADNLRLLWIAARELEKK